MALLYAIAAAGNGVFVVFFGGVMKLAGRIARGDLDTWMLRSQPVLLQAGTHDMQLTGVGDLATGLVLLVLTDNTSPQRLALFVPMMLVAALVALCFSVICHSAAFFFGNAEDLGQQGYNALVTFALYPPNLFSGWVRTFLFIGLPAGLMSHLPAELMRQFDPGRALGLTAGLVVLLAATRIVWAAGLKRYESGNLVGAGPS